MSFTYNSLDKGPLLTPIFNNNNSEAKFQCVVHEWALKLPHTEEGEYGILGVLDVLALAWNCIKKTSNNLPQSTLSIGVLSTLLR